MKPLYPRIYATLSLTLWIQVSSCPSLPTFATHPSRGKIVRRTWTYREIPMIAYVRTVWFSALSQSENNHRKSNLTPLPLSNRLFKTILFFADTLSERFRSLRTCYACKRFNQRGELEDEEAYPPRRQRRVGYICSKVEVSHHSAKALWKTKYFRRDVMAGDWRRNFDNQSHRLKQLCPQLFGAIFLKRKYPVKLGLKI